MVSVAILYLLTVHAIYLIDSHSCQELPHGIIHMFHHTVQYSAIMHCKDPADLFFFMSLYRSSF